MERITPIFPWAANMVVDSLQLASSAPPFERYIEPFFGGGQFFYTLSPKTESLLNDKNKNLIDFYKHLQNPASPLKQEILLLLNNWRLFDEFFEIIHSDIAVVEQDLKSKIINLSDVPYILRTIFALNLTHSEFDSLYSDKKSLNGDLLIENMISACVAYLKNALKNHKNYELSSRILQNGYYYHLRQLLNNNRLACTIPKEKKIAVWYFINLLGYSAQVNYSQAEILHLPISNNVPSYHEINGEINRVFNEETLERFSKSQFFNLDFFDFLQSIELSENDFVYVDPPFNSKWLHYEDSILSENQFKQLASILVTTKAQWMLVIKESNFKSEHFKGGAYQQRVLNTEANTSDRFLMVTNY
ncbi:MAG TPA: DNA adenine methylase [Salinivirgaceae bacterium]|nr:DNA adenine methylase [Salinivirgaceae bacterium]